MKQGKQGGVGEENKQEVVKIFPSVLCVLNIRWPVLYTIYFSIPLSRKRKPRKYIIKGYKMI